MRVTLDIPLSLWEIVNAVGSKSNPENKYINAICTDTREAHSGDLFIALNGENQSGEKYIKEAYEKNCYTLSSSHTATVCVTDTAIGSDIVNNYLQIDVPDVTMPEVFAEG